ncbi:unnamed protein product [Phyllotreta striolata]|uniref:COMM domain-containing protein n=1 Tax=Phyllotreta striolata TaxID=444603 RepID=A0A9N9TTM6_PHYSR|nr:unnamed protein product [Phyllotreta striolata]
MNLKWITVNERLKQGVTLINSISTKKFQLLLAHIANSKGGELFTNDEVEKLKVSLKINNESVQLLIQSIHHICKQSNKVILKPTVLFKQLCENLGLDEEKAEEFVKVWCTQTNEDIGDFNNRLKLENLTWELNVQTADQINVKQSLPVARIQLNLAKSTNTDVKENVIMEFDNTELLHLYNNLEKIQIKLDNINNAEN